MSTDFQDGVLLINFFQLLNNNEPVDKYIRAPKLKVHKLENIGKAFTYMEKKMGVRNPGIQAEDVLDINEQTNIKLVLGMIWTLFRKYRISVISTDDKSSEEGLLLWVKNTTSSYKNVHVEKWKTSFNDGLTFLALVHAFNPNHAPFDFNSFDPSDAKTNLQTAFDAAEKTMGIPKLLEVEDFIDGQVDERSLVLYTSLFFHAFNNSVDREAIEAEQRRRTAELEVERERKTRLLEENDKLRVRVTELEEQLKGIVVERDEFKEKDKYLEEKVDVMKQLLEQEQSERDQLLARRDRLLQEIAEIEQRLEIERAAKEKGSKDMGAKLDEELARVKKLQQMHAELEEEVENHKNKASDLRSKLDNEKRLRHEAEEQLQKDADFSSSQMSYLGVYKRNVEDHIRDLARWAQYLEYDKKSTLDFDVDVKSHLTEDMEGKKFHEQLGLLREKFAAEASAFEAIERQKRVEQEMNAKTAKKK
jgi:cortexillin 1/2